MLNRSPSRAVLAAALAALAFAGPAAAAEYTAVDPAKSRLSFAYKQMGVPLEGNFGKFAVKLAFDPAKPETARASMEVQLASIDTGSAEGNDEVAGKPWFNTAAFPAARFESTSVKALGANRYQVTGPLTIKGRTREVSAPVTFNPATGMLEGAFTLKRADYAIGEGMWADFDAVANEVQIKFQLAASAAK